MLPTTSHSSSSSERARFLLRSCKDTGESQRQVTKQGVRQNLKNDPLVMQARAKLSHTPTNEQPKIIQPSSVEPNPYEGIDFYEIDKPLTFADLGIQFTDAPSKPEDIVFKKYYCRAEDKQRSPSPQQPPQLVRVDTSLKLTPSLERIFKENDFYGIGFGAPQPLDRHAKALKPRTPYIRSPHGRQFDNVSTKASTRLQDYEVMELWVRFFTATSPDWERNIRDQINTLDGKPETARLQQLLKEVVETRLIAKGYINNGMGVTSPSFKYTVVPCVKLLDQLITAFRKCDLSPGLLVEARELAARVVRAV